MKSIDVKSLLIGALLTSTIFLGVAAVPSGTGTIKARVLWDDKQEWKYREFSLSQIQLKEHIGYELTGDSRVASVNGFGIVIASERAKKNDGLLVRYVHDQSVESPAKKAGLRANDIISAIDGKKFLDSDKLIEYIQKDRAKGDVVTVKIKRANLEMEFKVTLGFSHNEMVYIGRKRVQ